MFARVFFAIGSCVLQDVFSAFIPRSFHFDGGRGSRRGIAFWLDVGDVDRGASESTSAPPLFLAK